jgi:hypothetical protein
MAMAFLFLMYLGAVVVVVHGDTNFQYYQFFDSNNNIATRAHLHRRPGVGADQYLGWSRDL